MSLEAFVITNGKSTLQFVIKSLEAQTVPIKYTIVRDMKWVDALNHCLQKCESKHYIRIDDDMFLHKNYVKYILSRSSLQDNAVAAYSCRLFEDWTHKIAGTIKVYNADNVRKIGGFKVNKMGKVDKCFQACVNKNKMQFVKDLSVVGIHACGTWDEQKAYMELWMKKNGSVFYEEPKEYLRSQQKYAKSLEQQYLLLNNLHKMNRRMQSKYYYFLLRECK